MYLSRHRYYDMADRKSTSNMELLKKALVKVNKKNNKGLKH